MVLLQARSKYFLVGTVGTFIVSLLIFGTIVNEDIVTDIQAHAEKVIHTVEGEIIPPANFLYYLAIYTLAFFQPRLEWLLIASVLVLSFAMTAKFALTFWIFVTYYRERIADNLISVLPSKIHILAMSVLLLFVFSLPTTAVIRNHWYLGQIPPNIWHNSTTIFLMPLALGLFWVSYQNLLHPTWRKDIVIALLCILNILAKPSFFFVFALVYPVMLRWQIGLNQRFWRHIWPVIIGGIFLIAEYYFIYSLQAGNVFEGSASIKVSWLSVWHHYSPNIAISILVSNLYPFIYLAVYGRQDFEKLILRYTVLLYLVALVIMAVFSETGPREFFGNFFWQSYVCNYLLFMVVSIFFVERLSTQAGLRILDKIIGAAFFLHVAAGIAYLGKFYITGVYF